MRSSRTINNKLSTINLLKTPAFTSGQNIYVADFFELPRAVLALGGEEIRTLFLKQVGEHLDTWNTQPSHRQAWERLLEKM